MSQDCTREQSAMIRKKDGFLLLAAFFQTVTNFGEG
jgi:hypothetical protein